MNARSAKKTSRGNSAGLTLSIVTATMWGTLPVALKRVLEVIDPVTITWIRFVFATVTVGGFYLVTRSWPPSKSFSRKNIGYLCGVALALAANYWLFLAGLDLVAPPLAQVTIQLGPFFLALGSWLFFSESIRRRQVTGFLVMISGFWLFYSGQMSVRGVDGSAAGGVAQQGTGVWLVVLAALAWALYALIQKLLVARFPSSFILLCGYAGATIILLPLANPSQVLGLKGSFQWWTLLFCCVNTVIAYGCFAEAVKRWDATRVSAVLALTPVITYFAADVAAGAMTPLLLAGVVLVVGGSMTAALGARRSNNQIGENN
ncbi:MAG: hypothetical protein RIQ81_134 [Pseudomonadota bacterium]